MPRLTARRLILICAVLRIPFRFTRTPEGAYDVIIANAADAHRIAQSLGA
jgi:hypothetical protein